MTLNEVIKVLDTLYETTPPGAEADIFREASEFLTKLHSRLGGLSRPLEELGGIITQLGSLQDTMDDILQDCDLWTSTQH